LVLTDTAGLRTASDQIESIGVDRTKREAADSDLLVVVIDGSEALTDEDRNVLSEVAGRHHVIAVNKCDLPTFSETTIDRVSSASQDSRPVVSISAVTEQGLQDLRAAILKPFMNGNHAAEGLLITNGRHHDLLLRTIDAIIASGELLKTRASEELILVGLHDALRYLAEITGETTSDEILGKIFSTFCIGK